MEKIDVSIVIPVLNGLSDHLSDTLKAIRSQDTAYRYEVITIDSGSTDGTVEYLSRQSDVALVAIENKDFGHGRTRQYGASLSRGEFVVFLVQDATPADNRWLSTLIREFDDPLVVGVCSRVLPREDASLLKKINVDVNISGRVDRISAHMGNREEFERLDFWEKRIQYYFFNDISSAVRREYVMSNPIPDVFFGEDVEFAIQAIDRGRMVVYEPSSRVFHSHDYSLKKTFDRNVTDAVYHRTRLKIRTVTSCREVLRNTVHLVRQDMSHLRKYDATIAEKSAAIAYSPIIHFAEQIGQYIGAKGTL
jgi:rhamnosyltransferase